MNERMNDEFDYKQFVMVWTYLLFPDKVCLYHNGFVLTVTIF